MDQQVYDSSVGFEQTRAIEPAKYIDVPVIITNQTKEETEEEKKKKKELDE